MAYRYHHNGKTYLHPVEKTDYDHLYTDVGGYCPTCNNHDPYRHVVDDTCAICLNRSYHTTDHRTLPVGMVVRKKICTKGGHLVVTHPNRSKCLVCAQTPSPRQAAIAAGEKWYDSGEVCSDCKDPIMKRVDNGRSKCGCKPALSPRQAAIAAGDTWYDSGEICPNCGWPIIICVTNGRKKCGCKK